ncbi:MAG: hypothetical protein ACE5EH_05820 [Gammaproteobacteria bacterium]
MRIRFLLLTLVIGPVLALVGCSAKVTSEYRNVTVTTPLVIPQGLDKPVTDETMAVPQRILDQAPISQNNTEPFDTSPPGITLESASDVKKD